MRAAQERRTHKKPDEGVDDGEVSLRQCSIGLRDRRSKGYNPPMKLARLATIVAALAIVLAAPAHADVDTDFASQLHTYGIYGQRDFNAWLAKIACDRLGSGVDHDAYASTTFLSHNLPRGSTTAQSWQFLATAIDFYCPDLTPVLQNVAEQH
jgi:Protein of unknown function (DUF732)